MIARLIGCARTTDILSRGRVARLRRSAACAAMLALSAVSAAAQSLNAEIRALIDKHKINGAQIGVAVLEPASGQVLASINADEPLVPASNMKVLTSGAAVAVLGADFAFTTEFVLDGTRLIIRGSGDPALGDPLLLKEMGLDAEQLLATWTDAVKNARGAGQPVTEVIADDRAFDREYVHPSWPKDQLNRWYCAEIAGLNFHTNVLSIFARPGAPESPPSLTLQPRADWLDIQNRAVSKSQGQNSIWAARQAESGGITVFGNLRFALEEPVDVAITLPPLHLARLVADRLRAAGLGTPTARLVTAEDGPLTGGRVVAVVRSPMEVVLRRCNVNSYNLYAEALIKRLGHSVTGQPGSWESGSSVMRMILQERLGPADAASVTIADGSGMSRNNRVSAGVMTRWLSNLVQDPKVGPTLLASLPVAQKDGSLRNRFANEKLRAEIRAKTGYIREVSCLSGVITEPASGRRLVFSVLVNDFPAKAGVRAAKEFHEDIAVLGAEWLSRQVQRSGGLAPAQPAPRKR